jgi:hypothetical protein
MLDVHPPEHPAHSWSDFFIHMGTICLGLLIAIGLEQTVEWMHMRHRVAETREALAKELDANRLGFRANADAYRYNVAALHEDLNVLLYVRDHPRATEADLPGVMVLGAMHIPTADSAWNAAKQTGIVDRLPLNEVTQTDLMYQTCTPSMNCSRRSGCASTTPAATRWSTRM